MAGRQGSARFSRSVTQLGRALLITHCGVEATGTGWPSAVLDLTERVFQMSPTEEPLAARRQRAAARFADTMVIARPTDLARAFGWTVDEARNHLAAVC